ncbi:MAG: hypothetical protein A4E53_00354 [Pelotomaculum sp. PtaB.Bin104]|nr:MAG: hypothetical protein A4E53_00354 [Pelotomaculum sp. PtaB.Bin104]
MVRLSTLSPNTFLLGAKPRHPLSLPSPTIGILFEVVRSRLNAHGRPQKYFFEVFAGHRGYPAERV